MRNLLTIFICLFISCQPPEPKVEKEPEPQAPEVNYYKLGKEISAVAQAELLKNVKTALEEGGPGHAIEFCNIHATPLTDSISKQYNCNISRLSSKYRNESNSPSGRDETLLINHFLESSLEGMNLRDTLFKNEDQVLYYRPIMIGAEACLKCHGQIEKDISAETMLVINELYPEDRATNYRLGDFRGAWKITFEKN